MSVLLILDIHFTGFCSKYIQHMCSLRLSERSLQEFAEKQGSNVMEIVTLVKENEEILDVMKVSQGPSSD